MRRLTLGQTGISTSSLGFGCVQLTSHHERREAIEILEHAFALGITHFDVARAYGFGRVERIFGEFLRGKRDRVTVATKVGLLPPSGLAGNQWIIDTAKKVLRPFPGLLRRAKKRGAAMGKAGVFSPDAAIRSLETSLHEIGTDYVDMLMLHEVTLPEATSEPLIEVLRRQVSRGTVRCLGIASDFDKLGGDADLLPVIYRVVQFNDNAVSRNLLKLAHRERRALITHSIFKPTVLVAEAIAAHPHIARDFSSVMNVDLNDPKVVGSLFLHYALRSNSSGVVLFSSTDPARVSFNVRTAESQDFDDKQLSQFVEFVDEVLNPLAAPDRQDRRSLPSRPEYS